MSLTALVHFSMPKALVLERVRQLVRHDDALFGGIGGGSDEKFAAFGVVHAGNLFGQQVEHLLFERIVLRKQPQQFQRADVGVHLGAVLIFVQVAHQVGADLFLGAHAALQRLAHGQGEQLAHVRQHFIGGFQEFSVGSDLGRGKGGGRGLLGRRADSGGADTAKASQRQ